MRIQTSSNCFCPDINFTKLILKKGRGAPIHKGSQISMKISTPQCNVGLKQKMPPCSTVTFTLQVQLLQLWKLRVQKLRRNLPGLHQFCHQHHHHQKFKSPRNFSSFESFVTASVALPQLFTVQQSTCSNRKTNEESSGVQIFARARWKELGLKGRQ